MRVLAYRGEIFGTRDVSIRSVSRPREGRGKDEFGETECQSSRYVVLGIGWVVRETREWIEVVHSGKDRRTLPTGHGLHGWDSPDHRERD